MAKSLINIPITHGSQKLDVLMEKDDEYDRYLGTLSILGRFHHIEMIGVTTDHFGRVQSTVNPELSEYVDWHFRQNEDAPKPVEFSERMYIVYVTPFTE